MANAIPKGYQSIIPYLLVEDVDRYIDFLKAAFGAKLIERMEAEGKANHAEVRIGDCVIMMGRARGEWKPMPTMLYHYCEDVDSLYEKALALGAESIQPVEQQFYGDRTGAVKDMYGNQWWIATHVEDISKEELQRRNEERAANI